MPSTVLLVLGVLMLSFTIQNKENHFQFLRYGVSRNLLTQCLYNKLIARNQYNLEGKKWIF